MTRKFALALVTSTLLLLVVPTSASAHNVTRTPRFGTFGDDFVFYGKAWQPLRRVRWFYDQNADGTFEDTGRFFTSRRGRFTFRWRNEDTVDTHRMCFRQFDSRFQKTFFKCKRFTLLAD